MFFFYTVPFLVCILSGIVFFTGANKNVPMGLLFCVLGFVPMLNILFSCIGLIMLVVMAGSNKQGV